MCVQPFSPRQPCRVFVQTGGSLLVVDLKPRADAQERQHCQSATEAGCPPGRQDVIRSRAIITEHLRGVTAEEQRAVVLKRRSQGARICHVELKMFRRQLVTHYNSLLRMTDEHSTAILERYSCNVRRGQVGQLSLELLIDLVDEPFAQAHEHHD